VLAYILLGICALLCVLKWAYVTEIDTRNKRVWAFIFGMILLSSLTAGVALWTHYCKLTAEEVGKNLESREQIPDLQAKLDKMKQSDYELKKRVDTLAPKLDAMVNQLDSPEQKALALALREQLMPKIEVDEPSLDNHNTFDFKLSAAVENVGGSTARGVVATSNMMIAVKSNYSESDLFDFLQNHARDIDIKPFDIDPGYAGRANILIGSHPNAIRVDMIQRMSRDEVVYIGVLVTFFDSQGGKHYTEKCFYFNNDSTHVDHLCDGHNKSE
jgi:hypothetical protein